MSVLVGSDTRVIIQGLGKTGRFHTDKAIAYGTAMVGAVHPSRAGEVERFEGETDHSGVPGRDDRYTQDLPIYGSVREAVAETGANASVVYVPPPFAADAIMEAADAGVPLIIAITEGIPVTDMVRAKRFIEERPVRLVGPNCPGVITPQQCKIGIMPGYIHTPGRIGVVSRSGTLTYEAVFQLTNNGLGQTTAIGIGGDPVNGTNFVDCLTLFNEDPATEGVLMIGEIGGSAEEEGADYIKSSMTKPVAGFIAGTTAPSGQADGPCRGHHLRRERHRRRQDRRPRGSRRGDGAHPHRHGRGDAAGAGRGVTPAARLVAALVVVDGGMRHYARCDRAPTTRRCRWPLRRPRPSTVAATRRRSRSGTTVTIVGPPSHPEVVPGEVGAWVPEIVARIPHDPEAFTQGLLVDGDVVWESTGLYGESTLRRTDRETGEVLDSHPSSRTLFGEGLELVDDRLVQLTWQEETALVWDPATLEQTGTYAYEGEGWGLCAHDDQRLVMSNGSSTLTVRDPATFEPLDQIEVTRDGVPVANLNELECVDGLVFANVWLTDEIVVIGSDGVVVAAIDASALDEELADVPGHDVLNGIAYDPATGTFLLAGKLWPTTFEVRFVES